MEHANTAFIMAGGMLFALMIMSLVAFVFSSLTTLPVEEDSRTLANQAAAFNEEYLAYDKKIMYGTDVISVLNKALSNNEKYVRQIRDGKSNFVFAGGGYNTDYIIDIQVTFKSKLEENIEVSYVIQEEQIVKEEPYTGKIDKDGKKYQGPGKTTNYPPSYYYLNDEKIAKLLTPPSDDYQTFIYESSDRWDSGGQQFTTHATTTKIGGKTYHLLGNDGQDPQPNAYTNDDLNAKNTLKELLKYSTVMSKTIKNRGADADTFYPTGWSQVVWRPAIYDFKTRKFECVGEETVFSEKTGRVIKMVFKEI